MFDGSGKTIEQDKVTFGFVQLEGHDLPDQFQGHEVSSGLVGFDLAAQRCVELNLFTQKIAGLEDGDVVAGIEGAGHGGFAASRRAQQRDGAAAFMRI